ncbi:hypothetical protein VNO78_07515 [Psophocarpus tetragonolobus]|uniref:Uncharacterized protein n=1 Tax=Psophocarpus tetragonolobus TaxID=3891 RepID=A0AAN9T3C8_PSOTE
MLIQLRLAQGMLLYDLIMYNGPSTEAKTDLYCMIVQFPLYISESGRVDAGFCSIPWCHSMAAVIRSSSI